MDEIKTQLNLLRITRSNIIGLTENLQPEQLIKIPEGLNNHILWNMGHALITQLRLCYLFSNLPMGIPEEYNELFKIGSKPREWTETPDRDIILDGLKHSIDALDQDYHDGRFKEYKPYKVGYGVQLDSVEDAIRFDNMHEAMHLGVIRTLLNVVRA